LYHLQLISDIDHQRVGAWVHGDPPAFLEDLQPGHLLVHEKDGERVGVRVRREPVRQLRRRALGVEVHRHVLLLLAQHLLDVCFLQAQALGDCSVEPEPEIPHFSAVSARGLPVKSLTEMCLVNHTLIIRKP
jgi:hypothetical protein